MKQRCKQEDGQVLASLSRSNVDNKTAKTPQSCLKRPRASRLSAGAGVRRPDRVVFVFNFSGPPPPSFVEDCFLVTVNNSAEEEKADKCWIATTVTCVQPTVCSSQNPCPRLEHMTHLFVYLQRRSTALWPCWPFSLHQP